MTETASPLRRFESELLPMLAAAAVETAPGRPSVAEVPRRWRRLRLVVAAGAAVIVAVVAPIVSDDPLRGALAVEERGDTIVVSVRDATADPEAMAHDLRAHGLPANVEVVPVSPSLVGTWVDLVNDNLAAGYQDPRFQDVFRQISERPHELELPADFSTPFTLVVGRPAQPGETYRIALQRDVVVAFDCLGLAGLTPAEADEVIRSRGFEAWWGYERLDEVPVDEVIVGAEFHGPTTVIVHTADRGRGSPAPSRSEGGAGC
jgi:hypothetical protein